jgi:translation elongation factor EF-1beta
VIGAVVKDKVSVEELIEKINKVDGVQDVDIASFNEV